MSVQWDPVDAVEVGALWLTADELARITLAGLHDPDAFVVDDGLTGTALAKRLLEIADAVIARKRASE